MSYEDEAVDGARLRKYAKRVAERRRDVPTSYLVATDRPPVRRWWKGAARAPVPGMRPLAGWILLVNRYNGIFAHVRGRDGDYYRGIEDGQLILLTSEGELQCANYQIDSYSELLREWRREDHVLSDRRAATDLDLTNFDRLNRGGYRDANPHLPISGESELWRSELRSRCWIRVPHPGMEVSLALKRFNEQQSYFIRMYIDQPIGI